MRVALTGGASGIGAGIADRLKAEGAEIIVWDLQDSTSHETMKVDVTDFGAVEAALSDVSDSGSIDILVASAGITGPNHTTWDYPVDDWRAVFELNVHGVFNCIKGVTPIMQAAGYGRVVSMASIAGKEGNPNASAYSASKAAVIGLTKSVGKELATSGVTVNCVAPAAVDTPMFDQMTKEHIDYMKSKIPMGRFGEIDEIAAMVTWIASEEAGFVTGFCFDQSGGRAVY